VFGRCGLCWLRLISCLIGRGLRGFEGWVDRTVGGYAWLDSVVCVCGQECL
jgi:hypothetical protein